jgi:hypothetical protein
MKFLFGLVVFVILILLIPLTLLGQVPILSPMVGAGQKDLGIKISAEDSKAAQLKDGTEVIALPKGTAVSEDFKLEGKREVDLVFDSKELTAHSNNRIWINYPVKNLQIEIGSDGTIESSAIIIVSKFMPYATALGYSENQIRDAMEKYHIPPMEVPIYVKGRGSVLNDKVSVDAQTIQIGAVTVPANIVSGANNEAEQVLDDIILKHAQSFHAESVTFADGSMHFKGTLPVKEYVIAD